MPSRRREDEHQERRTRLPTPREAKPGAAALPSPARPSLVVQLVRYALPAAILLAGVVLAIAVPGETGVDAIVGLSGVSACVVLLNLLLRLGASGDRDRAREAAAREYYDEHGRWPDERRPAK